MIADLQRAIRGGLGYLARAQRPTGEWPTLTSPAPNLAGADSYPCSIYVTTFVIHALTCLPIRPPGPRTGTMLARAAAFLEAERNPDGSWSYEGRATVRVPPDLDDTSCAVAALTRLGRRPGLPFYTLLWQNEAAPGGPYYTWVGANADPAAPLARQVDALVNANIVYSCGLLGLELPGAAAYLRAIIEADAYQGASRYCATPHLLLYCLSRALADGQARALDPAGPALRRFLLAAAAGPALPAFQLACLAVALLNAGERAAAAALLAALLAAQRPDGSWPAWGAYRGYAPNFDGSPALTTALAIEAAARYLAG